MGNLINDFWIYQYKVKKYQYKLKKYYGVVEVVGGEDLAQNRSKKKYETHIEKALMYTMENDVLSHMSIQTYCTWLKDKPCREDNEQKYYPFILEFEANKTKKTISEGKQRVLLTKKDKEIYTDVVYEVAIYVNYLVSELGIDKNDILIMINNSKSIYVYVNPKSMGVKPEKDQHKIYTEIYNEIKKKLSLKYVDESIVSSGYKLMKTPNTYYNGGYFVWITIDELMKLLVGAVTKEQLTSTKRSLDKNIPGIISMKAAKMYSRAAKKVKYGSNDIEQSSTEEFKCGGKCVQYLLQHMIEKGYRNYGLVSVGIYLKSLGYSKEEVEQNLFELADSWNHDEDKQKIRAKVNTIFRNDYKFSCTYARNVFADLDIDNMCSSCKLNKKANAAIKDGIKIDADIINRLWNNNASTRHYLLYLKLAEKELFNKQFNAEDEGIDERTLRELCKKAMINRSESQGKQIIEYKPSRKIYTLPEGFLGDSAEQLGNSLKHYLKLFVKGYKGTDKYMIIRASKDTLMHELEYKDASALNKFLKKLESIGMLKYYSKSSTITLYYKSYKVIALDDTHEAHERSEEIIKIAVGEQISIKEITNISYEMSNQEYRGSPPGPPWPE